MFRGDNFLNKRNEIISKADTTKYKLINCDKS